MAGISLRRQLLLPSSSNHAASCKAARQRTETTQPLPVPARPSHTWRAAHKKRWRRAKPTNPHDQPSQSKPGPRTPGGRRSSCGPPPPPRAHGCAAPTPRHQQVPPGRPGGDADSRKIHQTADSFEANTQRSVQQRRNCAHGALAHTRTPASSRPSICSLATLTTAGTSVKTKRRKQAPTSSEAQM